MKKQVIVGIVPTFFVLFLCLPASAAGLAQSQTQSDHALSSPAPTTPRGCDGGYLAKEPLLAASCRELPTRILHPPIPLKEQIVSNWVSDYVSTVPHQAGRFTIPFLSHQWHFAASAEQPLDIHLLFEFRLSFYPTK